MRSSPMVNLRRTCNVFAQRELRTCLAITDACNHGNQFRLLIKKTFSAAAVALSAAMTFSFESCKDSLRTYPHIRFNRKTMPAHLNQKDRFSNRSEIATGTIADVHTGVILEEMFRLWCSCSRLPPAFPVADKLGDTILARHNT